MNPGATFYDKLLVKTIGPFLVPPLIYAYVRNDPDAREKTLVMSIQFFELVLSSVTTTILKTFDCTRFGHKEHLKAQLTLQSATSARASGEGCMSCTRRS